MLCQIVFWLAILNWEIAGQQTYQFQDIPIEHYTHEDIQKDEIDVELMPRSSRLLSIERNDPSDLNFQETKYLNTYFDHLHNEDDERKLRRSRRETPKEHLDVVAKPLEVLPLESENITKENNQTDLGDSDEKKGRMGHNFLINDFIRFKRDASSNSNDKRSLSNAMFVQRIPKESLTQSQAASIDSSSQKDSTRETRGATKEQWIKQSFPVQHDDSVYEDNVQLPSAAIRAPRVHFVTNEMSDRGREPLQYKFNREPRSESLNKYSPSDLSAEMDYYQPRFARNYVPRERYIGGSNDRYPSDRRDYYRANNYPEEPINYNPDYNSGARKRRIIYYATLPEVPRNSRIDDYRRPYDRRYRERYDDRYPPSEPYAYRKRHFEPVRYDGDRGLEPLYPIKVSTDVKVREVKKSPERRIYSDVDRTQYSQN